VCIVVLALMGCVAVGTNVWLGCLHLKGTLRSSGAATALSALYTSYKPRVPFMELLQLMVKAWVVVARLMTTSGVYNSLIAAPAVIVLAIVVWRQSPWHEATLNLGCGTVRDAMNRFGKISSLIVVAVLVFGCIHGAAGIRFTRACASTIGMVANGVAIVFGVCWLQEWMRGKAEVASDLVSTDAAWDDWRSRIKDLLLSSQ